MLSLIFISLCLESEIMSNNSISLDVPIPNTGVLGHLWAPRATGTFLRAPLGGWGRKAAARVGQQSREGRTSQGPASEPKILGLQQTGTEDVPTQRELHGARCFIFQVRGDWSREQQFNAAGRS